MKAFTPSKTPGSKFLPLLLRLTLFALLIGMLAGCKPSTIKPDAVPPGPAIIYRQVLCEQTIGPQAPELETLTFQSLIDKETDQALICLATTDHTVFQTNHIRLVGYIEELRAYNRYLNDCITRHNNGLKADSAEASTNSSSEGLSNKVRTEQPYSPYQQPIRKEND